MTKTAARYAKLPSGLQLEKKDINPKSKPKVTSIGIIEPTIPKYNKQKKICINCKQETGPGISHPCTRNSAKKNIAEMIIKESAKGQEQIISNSLKTIVNEKGEESGNGLRITGIMGGNPLSVTVGKSTMKPGPQVITLEFMTKLQKKARNAVRENYF